MTLPTFSQIPVRHVVIRVTLAVAGFSMGDLNVSVEDNQLVIRGRLEDAVGEGDGDENRVYLHRGIASRQFHRSFVLAEGIEVQGATMDNGLLYIGLERLQAEPEVRTIKIESGASGAKRTRPKTIDVQTD